MLKKYRSLRLIFASIMLVAVAVVGLAANFGNIKFFNAIQVQAEEKSTSEKQIEAINQPMLTLGTCDTAGPIEIESSGGTTAPTAYTTLKAGFDAINAGTHTGTVNIEVCGNTTETATAEIFASGVGASSYTSVTIRPVGSARTIEGTNTTALVKVTGADNVMIDGSLSGGTDRSLTISNLGTGPIIWIATNSTDGANNNTVKNSVLSGPGGFAGQGIIAGSGTTLGNPAEFPNSNNTIQNNAIRAVQNAAFISGNATTSDQNWSITDNEVGSATDSEKLSFRGFLISNSDNFTISRNLISGVSSSTTTTATMSGIQVSGNINGGMITRNEIKDIRQNNTVGWGANGIFSTAATTASNLMIANNFISDVRGNGFNGVTSSDNGYGIMINSGGGFNIYFNTINMNTNQAASGSITAAVNIAAAVTTAGGIDLRNNILANTQTVGTRYGVYVASTAGNAVFSNVNYNNYFAQNVGFLTSARATLANWQTATGQDANSLAVDPLFVSATDLHIQTGSPMVGAGVAIAGITNDFDGQNRPAMNPAIGADELVMAVPGALQFGSATYSVGEGGGTVTLTVSRTGGNNGAVTANYTLANGTATGGATCAMGIDFVNTGGTVSFADGEISKTFDVTVCEDMDVEGTEMFTSTLSNATGGATIGMPATTTVTINDNDASMSGTLALSSATYSVGESSPSVSITVNRTNGTSGAVTVNYSLTNGNATGGASCTTGIDFVNMGGTVSFADGEASKSFNVSICPDTIDEANETFNVTLSNPTGGAVLGTPITAVVTITDDDPSPSLSINDVTQNEGNSGTSVFAFTVTLSSVSGQTVTVNYQTADGTATVANNDYVAIPSTTLTFAPGETTKTVNVSVNGDTNVEPDEAFSVNLSNATNATIADNQGVGTIQNEDTTALSIADFNRLEGNTGTSNFTVTVTLSNITFQTVTVNYQTANGSATVAGNDYIAGSGTLTFAPGELTKTLNVSVIGDITFEFDETFFVNLSNATNAAISDAQAVGTIINDDGQSFRINDVRIREGNAGTTAAIFTVTLTPDPNRPEGTNPTAATVQYRTVDGTATFPRGDYLTAIGTLTFNPGETQKTIEVLINGDTTKESNETFFVDIFSPINASIADPQGYGIIIDDDRPYLGDFDRDQKSDYSVYRPDTSVWYVFQSSNNFPRITPYGAVGDVAVPGDYDGDGVADIAVYRASNNNWYLLQSQGKIQTIVNWGIAGDIPVQADYDGDGKTDVAMFRPSDGKWYVIQSSNNARTVQQFGANGDFPVIGDFDGDFKNDLTVFRNGVWYVLRSSDFGVAIVNWGTTGDKPVSGDFDGDGKTDYAIYRNGTWWIFYSLTNSFSAINWGLATDIPAPADYDGDGTTDVAIFRPSEGNWYVLRSSNLSLTTIKWGKDGDIPGPSAYSPRR